MSNVAATLETLVAAHDQVSLVVEGSTGDAVEGANRERLANTLAVMYPDIADRKPLTHEQAARLQLLYGKNTIAANHSLKWYQVLYHSLAHPFNAVLAMLAIISGATGDIATLVTMCFMIGLSIVLRFVQEMKSEVAAESLKELVHTKASVIRFWAPPDDRDPSFEDVARMDQEEIEVVEINLADIVPGDWVKLSAGDMIPGDCQILQSKDLFISQSALTGEAMPCEKFVLQKPDRERHVSFVGAPKENVAAPPPPPTLWQKFAGFIWTHTPFLKVFKRDQAEDAVGAPNVSEAKLAADRPELDRSDLCFMNTSVVSGTATAVVLKTGSMTVFGELAAKLAKMRPENSFAIGVRHVSIMFLSVMGVMVPAVFLLAGLLGKGWTQAFLFAIAVGVGLTPEMLPMIVSANLAKGALTMSKEKAIVKRLDSIINLGAIDILCTDKTGTLTQDKVALVKHVNIDGSDSLFPLQMAFLNSHFQTGLKNLLDVAVMDFFGKACDTDATTQRFTKVDEIPFDFQRRRMSIVLKECSGHGRHTLVTKGAVDETLSVCTSVVDESTMKGNNIPSNLHAMPVVPFTAELRAQAKALSESLNANGLRVIVVAFKPLEERDIWTFSTKDEKDLIMCGMVAFLDPPKDSSAPAIKELHYRGIEVKVLTGDSPAVCKNICDQIGLPVKRIVTTSDLVGLDDAGLRQIAEEGTIFARLTPVEKATIVQALKSNNHAVGFLGDGINDAPALKQADVGISVDTATDVAKETADIILLEKSLLVLAKGVVVGRITFGNTMKYIKMALSSNFGNVFSIMVATAWLPFLPMDANQIVMQNLIYDFSQVSIPWDCMDDDYLLTPKRWQTREIFRYMMFLGPLSSPFDISTFIFMWFYYGIQTVDGNVALFQTAWFLEGLLTQTLIVHMIRTDKIPFVQSIASWPVVSATLFAMIVCVVVPYTPLGMALSMTPVPPFYYVYLIAAITGYCLLMSFVAKPLYIRLNGAWM
ncbi:unnamed protein product (mitochondrion) [Plasmodiophora brassicae]|uniref:Magnesium-transporting ATPase, P-type 1 n=1 Tax=Plasmodiophora brassicae TaxID=37360 RepID=A0A0G4IS17_PLABS|nr:hypothetical protein PBRA_006078 [Plasmodiophora brassicae]SPQ98175.1 unnamed protein product [Plasmodiophora brassicae]